MEKNRIYRAYFWNENGVPGERLTSWQVFVHHLRYALRMDDWKVIQMVNSRGTEF